MAGPEATRRAAAPKTELQKLREERGTVSLTHLRGLLRDRQREDTLEYQQARRRQMTASLRVGASNRKKEQSADENDAASLKRREPGWLLYHGEEESKSRYPATLQSLCVELLGPVIYEYLDAFGVDILSSIFSSLPSNVLKELSVKVSECKGVDDALVQALGSHSHVEALALHSATGPKRVTAAGILSIVPRVCTGNNDVDERIQESWEDTDQTLHIEGCSNIRRLELYNLQVHDDEEEEDTDYERAVKAEEEFEDALVSLLSRCGRITHLSLGASFRSHPHRLFQSLPTLVPSLQVLDLNSCIWMDDTVLMSLLRAIALESRGYSNLASVDVSNCPSITEKGVSLANEMAYCMLGVKNIVLQR